MLKVKFLGDLYNSFPLIKDKIYDAELMQSDESCYKILNEKGNFDFYNKNWFEVVNKHSKIEWSDKHYNFVYKLKEEDIKNGEIKIDPYFVSKEWKLGSKDETGILFHILKTIARFGVKNTIEREIDAILAQAKRLKELNITKEMSNGKN